MLRNTTAGNNGPVFYLKSFCRFILSHTKADARAMAGSHAGRILRFNQTLAAVHRLM